MTDKNKALPEKLEVLKHFMSADQLSILKDNLKREEKVFFLSVVDDLNEKIEALPEPYGYDGDPSANVYLHYFSGAADWYILEKDSRDKQIQAFGYADLGHVPGSAELGYISIEELIEMNVELDYYFTPKPLSQILNPEKSEEQEPE